MREGEGVGHEHGHFPAHRWASERFQHLHCTMTHPQALAPMMLPPCLWWVTLTQVTQNLEHPAPCFAPDWPFFQFMLCEWNLEFLFLRGHCPKACKFLGLSWSSFPLFLL